MSLTALAFLGIYALFLMMAFLRHPIFGLYAYLWDFYLNPSQAWWGSELPNWRWSLIAAAFTLFSLVKWKPSVARRPWFSNLGAWLLVIFVFWMWVQILWAVNSDYHLEGAILYTKYLFLFYLIYEIVSDEQTFELFAWGHVIGCFIFGWIAYGEIGAGRLENIGGAGVNDANTLGVHLITGLTFAGFMFLGVAGKRRWIALGAIPFILNAIILTLSRGAWVGLLAAGLAAWYFVPRFIKRRVYFVAPLAVVLLLMLAHDMFWQRMGTIPVETNEGIEASAWSRVVVFKANWKMFEDHPLGAGFRGNEVISPKYIEFEYLAENGLRSAHNTFMAFLVDQGVPGGFLFLGMVLWAANSIRRIKSLDGPGLPPYIGLYGAAIGAAFVGLFVSGQFINLLRAEVQIWLIAALASLNQVSPVLLSEREEQVLKLTKLELARR